MADEPVTDDDRSAGASESSELADLQRERDDYKDRWLRKSAEFDNYRKRIERERREQADQSVVDLLRGPAARRRRLRSRADGRRRRRRHRLPQGRRADPRASCTTCCASRGVKPIDALGADFDPNVHQAVVHEESPEHREGEVIGELRKGYMMNDRLLRPAMVKVAKA